MVHILHAHHQPVIKLCNSYILSCKEQKHSYHGYKNQERKYQVSVVVQEMWVTLAD
jgi:hypothetical protein